VGEFHDPQAPAAGGIRIRYGDQAGELRSSEGGNAFCENLTAKLGARAPPLDGPKNA